MHGTYLGDTRLPPNFAYPLQNGDVVRFGSEVTRGPGMLSDEQGISPKIFGNSMSWLPLWSGESLGSCNSNRTLLETFPPLSMRVTYEWKESEDTRSALLP
jgi:hypothetical protein